jgi:hypothetical protein
LDGREVKENRFDDLGREREDGRSISGKRGQEWRKEDGRVVGLRLKKQSIGKSVL